MHIVVAALTELQINRDYGKKERLATEEKKFTDYFKYIEKEDSYLMLHRIKKEVDVNKEQVDRCRRAF